MSKYTVINKIENDAPFGSINLYTISFLTPEKLDKTKDLNIYGFKLHNGYTSMETAESEANQIESKNDKHDVYIGEMGKLHSWDDATKTDSLHYKNKKLNDLEKTRREHIAKAKLMSEQFKTDMKKSNPTQDRKQAQIDRMKKKLYEKGLVTQKDLDLINEQQNPKINETKLKIINKEMDEAYLTDYLDENESVGFKYGCITIYSSNYVKGLTITCFKIRGLFETLEDANDRVNRIKKVHPNDRCWIFEVGKWNVYSCTDGEDNETQLKKLNYAMKCHLDNLVVEDEKFNERVKNETAKAAEQKGVPETQTVIPKKKTKAVAQKTPATEEVNPEIQSLMDYLRDDELDALIQKPNQSGDVMTINC